MISRDDLSAALFVLRRSGDERCVRVASWMQRYLDTEIEFASFIRRVDDAFKATKMEAITLRMKGIVSRITTLRHKSPD